MKKANLLLALSSVAVLASCGGANNNVEIVVWAADNAVPLTQTQIETFLKDYTAPEGKKVTFKVNPVGEGDAASNMITDVKSGADIYFFAQDQLSRLVGAGALTSIGGAYKTSIESNNVAGAVAAGKVGDRIYAFPATADNGYFLYYNKAKFGENDVKTWEAMIAKAEADDLEIDYEYGSAWYNFGFFFGAGADSVWTTNTKGEFTAYEDSYDSDKGIIGATGLAKVAGSEKVVSNSSVAKGGAKMAAIVDGTWDYGDAKKLWGDNLACAPLPSFTVNNTAYKTGSFAGYKLVGVKPQTDTVKAQIALDIANYLTGEAGQKQRFETLNWGPSNKVVQNSDAVKAAPQLVALNEQNKNSKVQGQFPGDWWTAAAAIGTTLADLKNPTEAQIKATVKTYKDQLAGMLDE